MNKIILFLTDVPKTLLDEWQTVREYSIWVYTVCSGLFVPTLKVTMVIKARDQLFKT